MPKSLFVDPVEVRAPGKVTFNDIPVNQYNKTIAAMRRSNLPMPYFSSKIETNSLKVCFLIFSFIWCDIVCKDFNF